MERLLYEYRRCSRPVISSLRYSLKKYLALILSSVILCLICACRPTLHRAVFDNSVSDVQNELHKGGDVNAKDEEGRTALMLACMNKVAVRAENALAKDKVQIVRALIESGADVNAKDSAGMTALMLACMFVEDPMQLTWTNDAGEMAYVMDRSRIEIPRLLIENGADVNAKHVSGLTVLALAMRECLFLRLLIGNRDRVL